MTRYIKTVCLYYSDMNNADSIVNSVIKELKANGGKVVSITNTTFGFSPTLMVYTIIYEAEKEIETSSAGAKVK